ncbi:MAG: SulP family inorganic anion transporter [Acidimicrobiales bacterium]|nr:SulP family inorganic anion transporter [Acidimicrobiales bacterium]
MSSKHERSHPGSFLLSSLQGYRRAWLGADGLAALTLLAIAVPEQLAISRLAGMPATTGLFAFVAGTVAFALLGSNPQMSVGADSTIAPLFAVGVARLASTGSPRYMALVGLLAVVVGVLVMIVGLLRLGWIAEFLSAPIITGFLGGVAVIIVVHQLPDLFGVIPTSGSTLHRIASVTSQLAEINGWTLGVGVAVLAVMVGAERIDRRLPGALVGLVGSTILVAALGLSEHGVAVLGTLGQRVPMLGLSDLSWSSLGSVLPLAGVVALVVISQSAATTRAFADQGGYRVDVGRDFLGVGAGSVAAGLVGAFAVDASPPRTAAVASAGGRTQLAGLGAAAMVLLLIPVAGLLKDVPLTTLAAVLIYVAVQLFHVHDLAAVLRFDLWEFGLAIVTLLTVALIGVEQGIAVAVGLAVLDRARLSARPQAHVMARIPGTTSWEPVESGQHLIEVPGVLVVLFAAPLYFANVGHFRTWLEGALAQAPDAPRVLVLDVVGMHDVDYTGTRALSDLLDELDRRQVTVGIARAGSHVLDNLARAGLLHRIGTDRVFSSVDEAVRALGPEEGTA